MLEKLDTIDWANMEDGGNWAKRCPATCATFSRRTKRSGGRPWRCSMAQ